MEQIILIIRGVLMRRIVRFSLALFVMSLFSLSYLVASASADGPGYAPPPMGAPGMAPGYAPPPMGAPGMAPGTTGEASGSSYTNLSQPHTGPHDGPGEDGLVDISHCASLPPTTRPACEAAAHGGPGNHAP